MYIQSESKLIINVILNHRILSNNLMAIVFFCEGEGEVEGVEVTSTPRGGGVDGVSSGTGMAAPDIYFVIDHLILVSEKNREIQ